MNAKKVTSAVLTEIIAAVIAAPIIAAIFLWYNHVICQWPISYWQWLPFGVLAFFMRRNKVTTMPFKIVMPIAAIAQVAAWVGVIALPLIHR